MAGLIVCMSRCLYCRRQTPHEACHEHSEALHPGWWELTPGIDIDALWGSGHDLEPETCNDPACPVWEPVESEQLRESRKIAEVIL